jgi:hypothetical protein
MRLAFLVFTMLAAVGIAAGRLSPPQQAPAFDAQATQADGTRTDR